MVRRVPIRTRVAAPSASSRPIGDRYRSPLRRKSRCTPPNAGRPRSRLPFAWVLKNKLVSSAIAGARREAHWDSYMDALTLQLGPGDEEFVDRLVPAGHVSTPGYTDPDYPVEGRRVTG
jgi:aryl-alcohol dehydrogenase-like predicted oxidoreductase